MNQGPYCARIILMGIDDAENLAEGVTSAEIADACREVLGEDVCADIAAEGDPGEALGFAFAALIQAGQDDPEAFLKGEGILED